MDGSSPEVSTAVAARGRGLRLLAGALMAVAALPVAVFAGWPWLVAASGPWLAVAMGLDELQVEAARPGWSGMEVARLRVAAGGVRVQASRGRLDYRLASLARGRLESVRFELMTVRVARREVAAGGDAGPPGDIEGLFAALPAPRVEVALLQLEVPALDFIARGHFQLTDAALDARLTGISPDHASGMELLARLTRAGLVDLHVADGAGTPFLRASSSVGQHRVDVTGELELHGFALDLAAELAGLPPGRGVVSGRFTTALPWPLPDPVDWLALNADGDLVADWRPASGAYGLSGARLAWRLESGLLHADGAARVDVAGRTFHLRAGAEPVDLRAARGAGALEIGSAAGAPYAALRWRLEPDVLEVRGHYALRDDLAVLLQELVGGALPGQLSLTGDASVRLPWPLPEPLDPLDLAAQGSLRGGWQWPEQDLAVAGLEGTWSVDDRRISGQWGGDVRYGRVRAPVRLALEPAVLAAAPLRLAGTVSVPGRGEAPFVLSHDPGTGAGSLDASAVIELATPLAAGTVTDWDEPYDVDSGRVDLRADLQWRQLPLVEGTLLATLADVSAHYDEYLLSGASGVLRLVSEGGEWALEPSDLTVRKVDVGVTLEEIETGLSWSGDTVAVQRTTARVLGGRARAEPFLYHLPTGEAWLTLELEHLDLAEILALEGDQVTGTGRLTGTLPVTLRNLAVSIDGGHVRATGGGRLQVSSALAGGTGMPGLDFALRALQNFDYEVLQGDVAYTEAGDLTLGVRLEGRNPAVEGGRPIHYNLTVTENVPMLLRSLRLEAQVTRGIERRLTN